MCLARACRRCYPGEEHLIAGWPATRVWCNVKQHPEWPPHSPHDARALAVAFINNGKASRGMNDRQNFDALSGKLVNNSVAAADQLANVRFAKFRDDVP